VLFVEAAEIVQVGAADGAGLVRALHPFDLFRQAQIHGLPVPYPGEAVHRAHAAHEVEFQAAQQLPETGGDGGESVVVGTRHGIAGSLAGEQVAGDVMHGAMRGFDRGKAGFIRQIGLRVGENLRVEPGAEAATGVGIFGQVGGQGRFPADQLPVETRQPGGVAGDGAIKIMQSRQGGGVVLLERVHFGLILSAPWYRSGCQFVCELLALFA